MYSRISLALLFVVGASAKAQDIPRSCDIELPTGTGTTATIREDTVTHKRTTYLGRGVVAHCIGQGNTLTADSAEFGTTERDDWENGTERDDFDGIRELPSSATGQSASPILGKM